MYVCHFITCVCMYMYVVIKGFFQNEFIVYAYMQVVHNSNGFCVLVLQGLICYIVSFILLVIPFMDE